MFSKLLKHEFRATARMLLPVYALPVITALLFNLFIRLARAYDSVAVRTMSGLMSSLYMITIFGSGLVTIVIMMYRFYKNYMTDEGYLMFTLPVTTDQLICSKLLVAFVWTLLSHAVVLLSLFIPTIGQGFWKEAIDDLKKFVEFFLDDFTYAELVGYGVRVAVLFVLMNVASYLMIYMAISIGHSFANHKVLLSVVFYIAVMVILQVIFSFGFTFGMIGLTETGLIDDLTFKSAMDGIFILGIVIWVILSGIFYLVTHLMLRKRLNLQ